MIDCLDDQTAQHARVARTKHFFRLVNRLLWDADGEIAFPHGGALAARYRRYFFQNRLLLWNHISRSVSSIFEPFHSRLSHHHQC